MVASRIGGLPYVVGDGVTGLLFEPGDAGGLAGGAHSGAGLGVAEQVPVVHRPQPEELEGPVRLVVDGIVERMRSEVDFPLRVVATGGLAPLLARDSLTIEDCDEMLTLTGLRIIYEREQRRGAR